MAMLLQIKPGLLVNPARVELVTVATDAAGNVFTSVYILGRAYKAPGDLTGAILKAMGSKPPKASQGVVAVDAEQPAPKAAARAVKPANPRGKGPIRKPAKTATKPGKGTKKPPAKRAAKKARKPRKSAKK